MTGGENNLKLEGQDGPLKKSLRTLIIVVVKERKEVRIELNGVYVPYPALKVMHVGRGQGEWGHAYAVTQAPLHSFPSNY
ncbi:hypothetical protein VNO80_10094 [Phaseolus coccineus]|uniref:Uncharacterized protein n=1 Tax=Phaseolus coccineus TaxID=3886 RepID=A0AAN9RDI1_PHACN